MVVAAPPADPVRTYAEGVLGGDIVAGPHVRAACQRHLHDLERGADRGLVWDQDAADYAMEFISYLRLPEGEVDESGDVDGDPFVLFGAQQFIVGSIFGWHRTDGTRRFRTAYVEMGKGNGKTPLAAAVGLLGLVGDQEPAAEVYTAGVTRDQAGYLFGDARNMALASKALHSRLQIDAHNIASTKLRGFMRPVSSEGRSLDQKRVHMALIDEIHEHPTGVVVNKMRAGTKGRRNALIFEITNSGYDRHSICWQHHDYSVKVLDGAIDNDAWFAYVCALDEGDDWTDPKVWPKVNPGLGVTISHRYLEEQVAEALGMPANENLVKRLNFCVWTEGVSKWLDVLRFKQAAEADEPTPLPRGREAWGGLDLASTLDLNAFFELAPRADCAVEDHAGRCYDLRVLFWIPEEALAARVNRDHVPYDVWERDGWIRTTRGNRADQETIVRDVIAEASRIRIRTVGIDRWNTSWLTPRLQDEGLDVVEVGQGFATLSTAAKRIEADIAQGLIHHDGNPVLTWMVGNAVAEEDPAGNIKPSRSKSTEKIDGVAAWCDAMVAWMTGSAEEEEFRSVWEMPVSEGGRRDLTL